MFCKNCGKEVGEGMRFCDGCGAPLAPQADAAQQPVNNPPPVYQQNTTPPPPPPYYQQGPANTPPPASGDSNKVVYVLAYLGILCFLPLIVNPVTPTGKFHANQGLLLLITSFAGGILFGIIGLIVPILGSILSTVLYLGIAVLAILGMVNAYNGKQVPLPVIGKLFTLIK